MSNPDKFIAVRSLLDEAIVELESIEVGLKRNLYRGIEEIIEEINHCVEHSRKIETL